MIAVFGTRCDCFVFTPWTGLQVKRATSIIDYCINKTGIKCGTFDNAIKQFHRQRVSKTKKAEIKSDTAESMLGRKSGPALARPAGPPTTALLLLFEYAFLN